MARRIAAITTTRADYGLLKPLLQAIDADSELELCLLVGGTHLAPEHGHTVDAISADGFTIAWRIPYLAPGNDAEAIVKGSGALAFGIAEALTDLQPDVLLLLGDRYEMVTVATAANLFGVPVVHLNGGEITRGALDDSFRHAISKLSHIHLTAMPEFARRLRQLGEQPAQVHCIGEIGLDRLTHFQPLPKAELENALGRALAPRNLLVTVHPETATGADPAQLAQAVLDGCAQWDGLLLITGANADAGGAAINRVFQDYAAAHPQRALVVPSLGEHRYLSAMHYCDGLLGNSSSGLVEAPSLRKGAINIGQRQAGRVRAANIIDCAAQPEAIAHAIAQLYSEDFQTRLQQVRNPYGDGQAVPRALTILKQAPLTGLLAKQFVDLPMADAERSEGAP